MNVCVANKRLGSVVKPGKRKLNLVPMEPRNSAKPGRLSTSFELGGYTADIIVDQKTEPPIHHWIIQRAGSPEILYWGQEYTYEQAESAAQAWMRSLADRERRFA